jgi:cyanophycinase
VRHLLAALLVLLSAPAQSDPGTVIAVGGALQDDNEAVYRAILDAMPKEAPGIVVIPVASAYPGGAADRLADALERYGVERSRVALAKIATVDDPETPDVDESLWRDGAAHPDELRKIRAAGLIWFAGGDQSRIFEVMELPSHVDSAALAEIRQRLADGAVVAGTSAGAAALGEHMIVCGSPDVALTAPISYDWRGCSSIDEAASGTPMTLSPGLGFLPGIVFDQHFSQRARLTRLVRAVACIEADAVTGIGVDEDTAFVFDLAREMGHAVGSGTITLVDPSDGRRSCEGAVMDNVRLARIPAKPKD